MAEFPALPLWTDAYLADTVHLDVVESGAYLHLLIAAWRMEDCGLPNDPKRLARWARCSPRQWAAVGKTVLEFWNLDEGSQKWFQKRLLAERNRVRSRSSQASRAAQAKHLKNKDTTPADAPPPQMPEACPDDASISITITNKKDIEPRSQANGAQQPEEDPFAIPEALKRTSGPGTKTKRGTRIDLTWVPSSDTCHWFDENHPELDIEDVREWFVNYWAAKAGKDAAKLDWEATFKNGVLNYRAWDIQKGQRREN